MQSNPLDRTFNKLARLASILAALPLLALAAEYTPVRFSPPVLGWVLAPDGLQITEITGVPSSPRGGGSIPLPAAARQIWPSPDASRVLLRLETGIYLAGSGARVERLLDVAADLEVSAAWDRAGLGFAVCWSGACQTHAAGGGALGQWEVASGARPLAFSIAAGLVTATPESAEWHAGTERIRLAALPVAAAFRPGTNELWLLDAAGQFTGQDRDGRRTGSAEMVPDALGVTGSLDGRHFFAANAEGTAAILSISDSHVERIEIESPVDGVWPTAGHFAVRLHESAKRPIAVWNGETGLTGWMPAAAEVNQ